MGGERRQRPLTTEAKEYSNIKLIVIGIAGGNVFLLYNFGRAAFERIYSRGTAQ